MSGQVKRTEPNTVPDAASSSWWHAEWLLWLAVGLLLSSLVFSALDWHIIGHLTVGTTCRVAAGLIAVGRTIRKKEAGQ